MRILFRMNFLEALASAQDFMRAHMRRSVGAVDSPWADQINLVSSDGHIKIMDWSRRAEQFIDIRHPFAVFKHITKLDLNSCRSFIKSLDHRLLLLSIMTRETFGISAHFLRIWDKKFMTGLGNIHCTCCNWDLPSSSLRASRSSAPAMLSSWIGVTSDYSALPYISGSESGQQRHDIARQQRHQHPFRIFKHTLLPGRQVIGCEVRCRSDHQIHHSFLVIPNKNHAAYYFLNSYLWHLEIEYQPIQPTEQLEKVTSPINSVPLFVTLALSLNSDNGPDIKVVISNDHDCSQPLTSLELESCGVDLRINDPIVGYNFPDFYLQEVLALCDHLDISVMKDLLPWLEKEFGTPVIHPDPTLPPGWDREISAEGNSYFINCNTGKQSMDMPTVDVAVL